MKMTDQERIKKIIKNLLRKWFSHNRLSKIGGIDSKTLDKLKEWIETTPRIQRIFLSSVLDYIDEFQSDIMELYKK